MLIVLPPSETKAPGGTGAPLDLDSLSFPELNPARREIAEVLSSLAPDEALSILKISQKLRGEAVANTELFTAPTMPALERYTGVLYDALDAPSLSDAARSRLAVGSALFGLVRAGDLIPHYRLSGGTKLEGRTMKSRWGSLITDALTKVQEVELVVDLRSGTYQQLGRLTGAVTARVESVQEDGSHKVVSHFNKHYKGQLARVLATAPSEAYSIDDVAALAQAAGLTTETRRNELVLVI